MARNLIFSNLRKLECTANNRTVHHLHFDMI